MRVLIVTKLFPNRVTPLASSFNRQQFAALATRCEVSVIAPRPWFPGASLFSKWTNAGKLTQLPPVDTVYGQEVSHPRQLYIPKFGHNIAAPLTTGSLLHLVPKYRGKVDVLLASWAFPHGASSVQLGKLLDVPVVVKVHGSDINVIAEMEGPRKSLKRWLPRADRVVAVSRELGEKCEQLGVKRDKIDLVYNGVNTEVFHPRDRAAARNALGVSPDSKLILFVGWLLETKGAGDLASAFTQVRRVHPDAELVFVGDGPLRSKLSNLARTQPGIRLPGALGLNDVAEWMGACDTLCLPSWNEGTPNVVLEALSSGRRVVATDVGGIPDLITCTPLGKLVSKKSPSALADALISVLSETYDPKDVATLGSRGSWQSSADDLFASLQNAIETPKLQFAK